MTLGFLVFIYSGLHLFNDHMPINCPWVTRSVSQTRNATDKGTALMELNSSRERETVNKDHTNKQRNIEPQKVLSNQGSLLEDIFTLDKNRAMHYHAQERTSFSIVSLSWDILRSCHYSQELLSEIDKTQREGMNEHLLSTYYVPASVLGFFLFLSFPARVPKIIANTQMKQLKLRDVK